jgi:nucleotide-binding universal stress UspA family protein
MATKPVVVGVDGSEESLLAAEWAAMEAKRHHRPLRIVSAPATTPRTLAGQASSRSSAGIPVASWPTTQPAPIWS